MAVRPVDYLNTVTSMQHILQDVEVSLDRVRTEEDTAHPFAVDGTLFGQSTEEFATITWRSHVERNWKAKRLANKEAVDLGGSLQNEWKIRYDTHARYKRYLEMRAHRTALRIKYLREALRDGGLEYHRDYRLNTETFIRRLVDAMKTEQREKLSELQKKEETLDRDSQKLREERQRRTLLESETAALKLGSESLLWSESRPDLGEILMEKIDDVVDRVVNNGVDDDQDDEPRTRTFSRERVRRRSRGQLPRI